MSLSTEHVDNYRITVDMFQKCHVMIDTFAFCIRYTHYT